MVYSTFTLGLTAAVFYPHRLVSTLSLHQVKHKTNQNNYTDLSAYLYFLKVSAAALSFYPVRP